MVLYGCQGFIVDHLIFLKTQTALRGSLHIVLVYVRPASGVGDDLVVFSPCAAAMGYHADERTD
jgi:hypothetical protein